MVFGSAPFVWCVNELSVMGLVAILWHHNLTQIISPFSCLFNPHTYEVVALSIYSQDPLKLTGVKQLECCRDPIRIVNALRCLTGYQLTDNGLSEMMRVMTINQCQIIANGEAIRRLWHMLVLCRLREMAGQYGRRFSSFRTEPFHRVAHFCALQVA